MGRLRVKYRDNEFDIEFKDKNELEDILNRLIKCGLLPASAQLLVRGKSNEGETSTNSNARTDEIDENRVYEVVKSIVEERLKEGKSFFMLRELYVPIFGRELKIYRNPVDHALSHKLDYVVKKVLDRLSKELNVKFEPFTIHNYMGRIGKFKAYRIIRNEAQSTIN